MIDEVILSQQLLANLVNVDETKSFIFEVLSAYLEGDSSPLQNGRIDGKRVKRHLELMIGEAVRKKNPLFDLLINVNVEWGLRVTSGFSCRLSVGVRDFDLTPFGSSVVVVEPLWQ